METLADYRNLDIDWNMTPEEAVVLYLEWGNNNFRAERPPVRSKDDESIYFVVNTWDEPTVTLVRRNSEDYQELCCLRIPEPLAARFQQENGRLKGVYAPNEEIKSWLAAQLDN